MEFKYLSNKQPGLIKVMFTTVLCNLIVSFSYSQLLNESNSWKIIDTYGIISGGSINCYFFDIKKDTIINDTVYKLVYQSDNNSSKIKCLLRGTDNQKYYLRDTLGREGLIYDFKVKQNDTLTIFNPIFDPYNSHEAVVVDSTSITISDLNFTQYTIQSLEIPTLSEVWITEIGSLKGLIYSGFGISGIVGAQPELLCFYKSDKLFFLNPDYPDCSCKSSSINDSKREIGTFDLSPNPVDPGENLSINLGGSFKNPTVYAFNSSGQMVRVQKLYGNLMELVLNGFNKSGIYLIIITDHIENLNNKLIVR